MVFPLTSCSTPVLTQCAALFVSLPLEPCHCVHWPRAKVWALTDEVAVAIGVDGAAVEVDDEAGVGSAVGTGEIPEAVVVGAVAVVAVAVVPSENVAVTASTLPGANSPPR